MCTINEDHIICGFWNMRCSRQNSLSFWAIFCPITSWRQNFGKMKKHLEILSFYACVPYMTIIWCMVPEIWSVTDNIFCHFGPFFALLPPNNPKNKTFEKVKKKNPDDVIILHECTKNHDHMLHYSWDTMHDRCNSYFLFWTIFHPFTPLTTQKIKSF